MAVHVVLYIVKMQLKQTVCSVQCNISPKRSNHIVPNPKMSGSFTTNHKAVRRNQELGLISRDHSCYKSTKDKGLSHLELNSAFHDLHALNGSVTSLM